MESREEMGRTLDRRPPSYLYIQKCAEVRGNIYPQAPDAIMFLRRPLRASQTEYGTNKHSRRVSEYTAFTRFRGVKTFAGTVPEAFFTVPSGSCRSLRRGSTGAR